MLKVAIEYVSVISSLFLRGFYIIDKSVENVGSNQDADLRVLADLLPAILLQSREDISFKKICLGSIHRDRSVPNTSKQK